jgi:hypothetical protein
LALALSKGPRWSVQNEEKTTAIYRFIPWGFSGDCFHFLAFWLFCNQ